MAQQHCLSAGPPASDGEASFRAFKGCSAGQTAAPSSPLFSGCLPTQWTSSACAQKKLPREKEKGKEGGGRKKAAQLNGIPLHNALGEAGRPVAAPSALALCVSPPGSDAFARGETLRQKEDGKKERRGIRWRAVFLRHAFKMSQRPCRWPRTEVVHRVSKAREKVSSGRELCSGSFTFEPAEKDKDKNLGSLQC